MFHLRTKVMVIYESASDEQVVNGRFNYAVSVMKISLIAAQLAQLYGQLAAKKNVVYLTSGLNVVFGCWILASDESHPAFLQMFQVRISLYE